MQIRPLEPADRELIKAGFDRLGPESRYRRFFSPAVELTERQLDYLTQVDQHDHVALDLYMSGRRRELAPAR